MKDNPFEPPRAEIAESGAHPARPVAVAPLALLCVVFMLGTALLAAASRSLIEAVPVIFFSAFLWFVPVGLLRGRPWAPAAATAAGLFVAAFAFGSVLVAWHSLDAVTLVVRIATGAFGLVLAGAMLALRKNRFFGVMAVYAEEDG